MGIEELEVKPYAESVTAAELKEGSVYFSVTFVGEEMAIPVMETLLFVGKKGKRPQNASSFESVYGQRVEVVGHDPDIKTRNHINLGSGGSPSGCGTAHRIKVSSIAALKMLNYTS